MNSFEGQSIGRYHVIEQLGEGGMASVYLAYDTRLERQVALKAILPSKRQSDTFIKRFEREAKSMAQLSHPNIIKVHDYVDHDGLPYLIMEYTQGGTLKEKLGELIHWTEAARLLAPIASALAYAHENDVVHRDIKPGNILITESGQPMLADFGIAKILQEEETQDLTGPGVGIGTPEYMAPEQGKGLSIDHRADIYALGIVLYELVTGRKPFRADTPMAVVIKHMQDPLPRPKDFVPDIPKEVEQVIIKALAKAPEDRYQEMGEFAQALEQISRSQKVSVRTFPSLPTKKHTRSRRIGLFALLAAVVLLSAWGLYQFWPEIFGEERISSDLMPAAEPTLAAISVTNTPMQTPTPSVSAIESLDFIIYDDFNGRAFLNFLLWNRDTDFLIEDDSAVFKAYRGEVETYRSNMAPNNQWTVASSGAVRFWIESKIQVSSIVINSANPGSAGMQLSGPMISSEVTWFFHLGYSFADGAMAYECVGAKWTSESANL